jgi:hypothetical protein
MSDRPELRDGGEWAEHEDLIIGNEEGLRRLRDACDIALRDGEYSKGDLGEWVGVRRIDTGWFKHPEDSMATRVGNKLIGPVLLGILGVLLVGLVTIADWLREWFT